MSVICLLTALLCAVAIQAQDSLVTKIAAEHYQKITFENRKFSGKGISDLLQTIKKHRYILIGEDHLNNEVLDFTNYLTANINFDNYITETDQLSINILAKAYRKDKIYQTIVSNSKGKFSLLSFDRDRNLAYQFFEKKKNVIGLDNVFFNADMAIFQELIKITDNPQAKTKYEAMLKESTTRWNKYTADPDQKPLSDGSNRAYMLSGDFSTPLVEIQKLKLSKYEYYALEQLAESNKIYSMANSEETGLESHFLRISTMKEKILNHLGSLKGKRNLVKFGANHVGKEKSLIQNSFDIGNLIYNLADAEQEQSLHIAVIQKGGRAGSLTSESTDAGDVAFLKPFYQLADKENECLLLDLTKITEDIKKNKILIKSTGLKNLITGYDYLIIIPKVTAQKIVV